MSASPLTNLAPVSLGDIKVIDGSSTPLISAPPSTNPSYNMNSKFGNILMLFMVIMVVSWVLLYTFNPKIVQSRYITTDGNGNTKTLPDAGRCFISSLLLSAVITLAVWFAYSCK